MIKTRANEVSSFYPCLFSFCYSIVQVDEHQFSLAEVVLSGALPEGTVFFILYHGDVTRGNKKGIIGWNNGGNELMFT